jgi:hypothetical protein
MESEIVSTCDLNHKDQIISIITPYSGLPIAEFWAWGRSDQCVVHSVTNHNAEILTIIYTRPVLPSNSLLPYSFPLSLCIADYDVTGLQLMDLDLQMLGMKHCRVI